MEILSSLLAIFVGLFLWAALALTTVLGRVGAIEHAILGLSLVTTFVLIWRLCRSMSSMLWMLALTPLVVLTNFLLTLAVAKMFWTEPGDNGPPIDICMLGFGVLFVILAFLVAGVQAEDVGANEP